MPGPSVVYYARHAENVANVTGQLSNRAIDLDLTERGLAQARQLAAFLAGQDLGPGPIFASPLRRAIQTAELAAERLGRSVQVIEAFRETDMGDLEGRSGPEALAAYWEILEGWRAGDRGRRFPGGESHIELVERLRSGFAEMLTSEHPGPFVLCAHAGILRAGFTTLLAKPFETRIAIPNCSVSRLEISDTGQFSFAYVARSDFLREETSAEKP